MIYLLVFLSGAAALVYEVVWGRQLATFLGITGHAHTVVLATFMAGLALGSRVLGAAADRVRRPLALFGLLEAGIGLFAVAAIGLVPRLQEIYATWARGLAPGGPPAQALRFLMAVAALLVPTFLMGGTLPALVRGLARRHDQVPGALGRLYGANTLGAAGGALAAGYLLLPVLGTRGALATAVAANLLVAAAVLWPRRAAEDTAPVSAAAVGPTPALLSRPGDRAVALPVLALSGFAALAAQLAWVRALTLVLGSSVYAFSLTLGAFLAGLALGSLLYARALAPRLDRRLALRWAAGLEAVVGLSIVAGLPLIGRLPELFLAGYEAGVQRSFALFQGWTFALAWSVLLAPTLALGALFPLLTALAAPAAGRLGRDVGTAAAFNSLGTIAGAALGGLALLPALGVQGSLVLAGGIHVLAGGLVWQRAAPARRRWSRPAQAAGAVAGFALLAASLPPWDPVVMTSGPFINAARILDVPEGESFRRFIRARNRVLYYAEGADGNVSVRDVGDERLLVINGKTDGSRLGDRKTQLVIGYLPLLAHADPRRVLVIGMGTGMTAAAVAADPEVRSIDVLELSREVVEASRFFLPENRGVLLDPRTRLLHADARNYLHTTDALYDVIVAEPSNPWISGVSNLFTREFFHLALRRLALGGVMSQWFHTYAMSDDDLRTILATYERVFPYVTVWVPQVGDLVLLGSRTPHRLRLDRLAALAREPGVVIDLGPHELLAPPGWARMFLFGPDETRGFAGGAELNTDGHPRVEFNAPRSLYRETTFANMERMVAFLDGRPVAAPFAGLARPAGAGFGAFGLEVETAPGEEPEPAWLVAWTAPVHAEPGEVQRFAVGNRRVLRTGSAEIQCGYADSPPDPDGLGRVLAGQLPGEIDARGETSLADRTPAVWITTDAAAGSARAGLAWTCGEDAAGFSRYLALVDGDRAAVESVAARLRCAARPALPSGPAPTPASR